MSDLEIAPAHSAFLELEEERAGMQEGYGFLDEKRLILASEILVELGRYGREMGGFRRAHAKVSGALRSAAARHGSDGLELYPRIDASLGVIGVLLEELEREEAIRVRQARTGP